LHRRELLKQSALMCAAPFINFGRSKLMASDAVAYSTRTIDLVERSNVIDMLGLLTLDWQRLDRWQSDPSAFSEADLRKLRVSGIDVFHPAVAFEQENAYEVTRQWFAKWNRFLAAHPDCFARVDDAAGLARAREQKKIGIILGMQDANYIRSVEDIDVFYRAGQRVMQLTYNAKNRIGGGCQMSGDCGLTAFGHEVVTRMNRIGMVIDVSHCGERTTLDATEASPGPVLITHSNCKALAPGVARCKSDEEIRAVAQKGGVIGLTGIRHFVRAKDPVTIENMLDHFDHAVKVAGVEHVGVGSDSDLDGRDRAGARPIYDIAGLNHPRRIYALTEGLVRRGYSDEHIGLILGGNFQRALGQIWV
jgi:membrane dipeptidase